MYMMNNSLPCLSLILPQSYIVCTSSQPKPQPKRIPSLQSGPGFVSRWWHGDLEQLSASYHPILFRERQQGLDIRMMNMRRSCKSLKMQQMLFHEWKCGRWILRKSRRDVPGGGVFQGEGNVESVDYSEEVGDGCSFGEKMEAVGVWKKVQGETLSILSCPKIPSNIKSSFEHFQISKMTTHFS